MTRADKRAGYIRKDGYRYITLLGVEYRADKIAWLITYGEPVPDKIEHIDGDRANDAIANLRPKVTE